MEVGVFYLPSIGNKTEISAGMAGRRTDLYQRMLGNLGEQARYLDDHGYYGVAFTEHRYDHEERGGGDGAVQADAEVGRF